MSSTFKTLYSGAASSITFTQASLASTSLRQAAAVDNGTNEYLEAALTWNIKTGASGVSSTGYAALYVAGYDGSSYANNATGSDSSFTVDNQANLVLICTLAAVANATTYYSGTIYVAAAAGWLWLPQKWALIVYNGTGAAFDSTGGNFLIEYQGQNTQAV